MKKTINLLQLQKVAHKSLTDKEFLFSSINNDDTPAHIDYRLIFQNMKIIPDKNEIVFSNKDGKINIRAVCHCRTRGRGDGSLEDKGTVLCPDFFRTVPFTLILILP